MKWRLSLIFLAGLMLAILVFTLSASAQTEPPQFGDWRIEDETVIDNQNIVLKGSLLVLDDGNLTLRNSTISFQSLVSGSRGVTVFEGGRMAAYDTDFSSAVPLVYNKFWIDGEAIIVRCDITDLFRFGVSYGEESFGIIMDSTIHDSAPQSPGIALSMTARVEIRDNDVFGHNAGIEMTYDSEAVIEGNEVYDINGVGIHVVDSAKAYIGNNTVRDSGQWGVVVKSDAEGLELVGNDIHSNLVGFQAENNSNVALRENRIHDNLQHGVKALDKSFINLHDNEIYKNGNDGVYFVDQARGYLEGNDIHDNVQDGILLMDSANVEILDNRIASNDRMGLAAGHFTTATVIGNEVVGNAKLGLGFMQDADAIVKDNLVDSNGVHGIQGENAVNLQIINNTVTNNLERGIQSQLDVGGKMLIQGNTIAGNLEFGIIVSHITNTGTQIIDNVITGSGYDGIRMGKGAQPLIENCTITNSGDNGILISDISSPRILNTSISISGENDLWVGTKSSPLLIGTAIEDARIYLNDTDSSVRFGLWVWLQVEDSAGLPVGGAAYEIIDNNGETAYLGDTPPLGRLRQFVLVDRVLKSGGLQEKNPYTFRASYDASEASNTINVTSNMVVKLRLANVNITDDILDFTLDFELPADRPVRDFVRGRITLRIESGVGIAYVEFFLKDTGELLFRDDRVPFELDWDTTNVSNGQYVIEAVGHDPLDRIVSRSEFAISVFNSQSDPVALAAAVGLSSLASAGAAALLFRGSGGISGGASGAASQAGDFASEYGEEVLYKKTASVSQKFSRGPGEIGVVLVTALGLGAAFAFVLGVPADLAEYLAVLPSVLMGAALVIIVMELVEAVACRALGITSRFSLWGIGLVALLASAFIFRAPFGSPGKTMVDEEKIPPRPSGAVALMKLMVPFMMLIPFLLLLEAGYFMLATAGITTGLMLAAYDAVPFRPMEGQRVAGLSKSLSAGVLIAGFAIMWCWQAALLPLWAYYFVGLAGIAGFIAAARGAGQARVENASLLENELAEAAGEKN